jgi:hypothetical protein
VQLSARKIHRFEPIRCAEHPTDELQQASNQVVQAHREIHLPQHSRQPTRRTAFIADTTALIVFFTTTGILNERFIAGMSWDQVLHARLLGALLMVPVARPYGVWRDWLMQRASERRLSKMLWDSIALVSFQVPIYAAIIAFSGASGAGLLRGTLGAAVMMLCLGRPYGAFLNLVRKLFGLPAGGAKPMSLNS